MTRGAIGLLVFLAGATGLTMFASHRGWGMPQPDNQPVSIREGSTHGQSARRGHYPTMFFMGGGPRYGK